MIQFAIRIGLSPANGLAGLEHDLLGDRLSLREVFEFDFAFKSPIHHPHVGIILKADS